MKRDERRKFPYYGILPLILTLTANFIAYFGTRPFTSSWKHYNIETVLDQQIYTQDETVRYEGDNKRESDQIAATNQFEDVAGDVTYLSRADGFANYDDSSPGV